MMVLARRWVMSEPDAILARLAEAKMPVAAADHGVDAGLLIGATTRPPPREPIRVRHTAGWRRSLTWPVPEPCGTRDAEAGDDRGGLEPREPATNPPNNDIRGGFARVWFHADSRLLACRPFSSS